MVETRRFGNVAAAELGRFSTEDLLEIYNELAPTPVRGFDNHSAALKAIIPLFTKPDTPAERIHVVPADRRFCLPVKHRPQKAYRAGTKLARLIFALSEGVTYHECREIVGGNPRPLLVGKIHEDKGFGLEERDDGKIYLLT